MGGGGAAAAAAQAAMIQAVKASGAIVQVAPRDFQELLRRQHGGLVIHATGGLVRANYQYLTSYKGLAFYTKSRTELDLPRGTEVVKAAKIWVPS